MYKRQVIGATLQTTQTTASDFIFPVVQYKIRVMEAEAALKDAQAGATVIGATLQTTQTRCV